ncbi:helix-turn-helix transcriptional regulator [Ramlibacter ginsenosidimutans]
MRNAQALSAPGQRPTLASLRLRAGMSQAQLASALGTQQPNVARWERNPGNLEVATLKKLASALGVSVHDVLVAVGADE